MILVYYYNSKQSDNNSNISHQIQIGEAVGSTICSGWVLDRQLTQIIVVCVSRRTTSFHKELEFYIIP